MGLPLLRRQGAQTKYDLQQSEVKPYFELGNIVAGALWAAEQRYEIAFREITGRVPVFHPDVRVWEVTDTPSGAHRGLFYLDNFAREGKRSGAWAAAYRTQSTFDGPVTAITSNNNNFVKGAPGEPVLISLDDAETLFHEFGHALRPAAERAYPGLAVTPRDFVEYPSQVNEHWLLTREVLDRYARHLHQTKEPMPQALVDKIVRSETFNQGYTTVGTWARRSSTWTCTRPPAARSTRVRSSATRWRASACRARSPCDTVCPSSRTCSRVMRTRPGTGYLWSEVMDADTWKAFLEAGGPWDKAVAKRLRGVHRRWQYDRSSRSLSPVPQSRSGCESAARTTRVWWGRDSLGGGR